MPKTAGFEERIRAGWLRRKVMTAREAAGLVSGGMTVAVGAGNSIACPKSFFTALAERMRGTGKIRLLTGGPVAAYIDGLLTEAGAYERRIGQFSDKSLLSAANNRQFPVVEYRTGLLPHHVKDGRFGRVDIAAVEATAITEDGFIVPSTSCLDAATYAMAADRIVVEINAAVPLEFEGIHDIYVPDVPPRREPIPLKRCGDRIGTPFIPCRPEKIAAIVRSEIPDNPPAKREPDEASRRIAGFLVAFLEREVRRGWLPESLLPLQFGIGSIPEALTTELSARSFSDLEVFTGAVSDGALDLIDSGKVRVVSTSGLYLSRDGFRRLYEKIDSYRRFMIIRPVVVSDCPELVARLGVIAINGALEVDIYSHVNSSHLQGTRLVSGIGGSCDFAMNAYLSVIVLPSVGSGGAISRIVPMATHVDQTEHTVDIIVTERGLADLRGLAPVERAETIIDNCVHPDYQPFLRQYLEGAVRSGGGHQPHDLQRAFKLHLCYQHKGDMRLAFDDDPDHS
jgi:succinyl-CoA:acetate CoA-transferase